jgi:hypothetical protein
MSKITKNKGVGWNSITDFNKVTIKTLNLRKLTSILLQTLSTPNPN